MESTTTYARGHQGSCSPAHLRSRVPAVIGTPVGGDLRPQHRADAVDPDAPVGGRLVGAPIPFRSCGTLVPGSARHPAT